MARKLRFFADQVSRRSSPTTQVQVVSEAGFAAHKTRCRRADGIRTIQPSADGNCVAAPVSLKGCGFKTRLLRMS